MLFQRSASCCGRVSGTTAATAVATFARSEIAEPCPRGWTALVKRMMKVCVVGSIQMEVPVNPVCPNEPTGKNSPRLDENGESMSQPKPRSVGDVGGCCGDVIFCTARDESTGLPS